MLKNIFVFGLNTFNWEHLKSVRRWDQYKFHELLHIDEVKDAASYPFEGLLSEADEILNTFPGPIDAIINYWDFPASVIHPLLCQKYGLRGPSVHSVLKCGHKYWSRLEQRKVIPDYIPRFQVFDPFEDQALQKIGLEFPFWIKPVLSYSGYLGFRIETPQDFATHIQEIRNNIERYSEPFKSVLEHVHLPEEIAERDASYCLAEEIITGQQCTVEGYVLEGKVETYGVIDSHRFPNGVSFSRYQYPSSLPEAVRTRIDAVSRTLMLHLGYDNAAFNIEYFYDETHDSLKLLEVNSRISQSHSDLFEKVDGRSNHEIVVEVALGNRPSLPGGKGPFQVAAKLFIRQFEDGLVQRVPTAEEVAELEAEMPGTTILIPVREGMRLSEILDQDSYSYQLAIIYTGAENQEGLMRKYDRCVEKLRFQVDPI